MRPIIRTTDLPVVGPSNKGRDDMTVAFLEYVEVLRENNYDPFYNFGEILADPQVYDQYVDSLLETSEDETERLQLRQLYDNTREEILKESTFNSIAPIQSIIMPLIRKLWAKTAFKEGINTVVAKVPTMTIKYEEPYIKDRNGNEYPLPDALYNSDDRFEKPAVHGDWIALADIVTAGGWLNLLDLTIIDGVAASAVAGDAIDSSDLMIYSVEMRVDDGAGGTMDVEVVINSRLSFDQKFYHVCSTVDGNGVTQQDIIMGSINCDTGQFTMSAVNGIIQRFKFKGTLIQDANTRTDTIGFRIKTKNISIPHGPHLDAPMPIEPLQDLSALYNIDGVTRTIDLMSQTVATKIDKYIQKFLVDSFNKAAAGTGNYPYNAFVFTGTFDANPTAGYSGSPTSWRTELRSVIDWWANKLQVHSRFSQGYFVVFGNPLDMQLIPDIDWQFTGVNRQKGGVGIDYNIGIMTNTNNYIFIASSLMPQGKLRMVFNSLADDYYTYRYFAYTFNIQKDYRNSNMPNVPNVMMTKRDLMDEFVPMQIEINILNNDGAVHDSYEIRPAWATP